MSARAVLAIGVIGLAILWGAADTACRRDPRYPLDGMDGCLMAPLFGEDTQYASGYSTEAFRKLRAGMSKDEVFALLGEPLGRYPVFDGREGWRWTRSPGDHGYRVRVTLFTGERISEIIHHYYLD
jgi:hypothetical protein